jgi:hypothetical protein
MIYICNICEYDTDIKCNFDRHKKSDKHLKNRKKSNQILIIIENDNKTYICEICKKTFKHISSLSRHKTRECVKMKIIEKDSELKKKEVMIKEKDKQIDDIKDTDKFLKDVVKNQNKIIYGTSRLFHKNLSIINFLMAYVPTAPPLEYFKRERIEQIIYNGDVIKQNMEKYPEEKENHFPEHVIYTYNHNTLMDYLCGIIIEEYKKKDPRKQAMWISDIPRTIFTVNKKSKKKKDPNNLNDSSDNNNSDDSSDDSECENNDSIIAEWIYDKKGLYVKEIVIDPLMDYVLEKLKLYVENTRKWILDYDEDIDNLRKKQLKQDRLSIALEIISELKSKSIHNKLVKAIAPMFYMTPELRKTLE